MAPLLRFSFATDDFAAPGKHLYTCTMSALPTSTTKPTLLPFLPQLYSAQRIIPRTCTALSATIPKTIRGAAPKAALLVPVG